MVELRTFLPTLDFGQSVAFYEMLGFDKIAEDEVAIFDISGSNGIILQRHYDRAWAENTMLSLLVDNLDGVWAHIEQIDLPRLFPVQAPKAPVMQPWGLRVGYLFDPAGVLWHIVEGPRKP